MQSNTFCIQKTKKKQVQKIQHTKVYKLQNLQKVINMNYPTYINHKIRCIFVFFEMFQQFENIWVMLMYCVQ